MKKQDEILSKIKKLLALSGSPNEHEARLAAERANELLLRHNLSMQDVESKSEEDGYIKYGIERPSRLMIEETVILMILQRHYFVRVVTTVRNGKTLVYLLGSKTNVEVATYVHSYLLAKMKECWLTYKKENAKEERSRKPWAFGFKEGLDAQLDAQKKKVEQSMALVLKEDKALVQFSRKEFPNTRTSSVRTGARDSMAQAAGFEAGKRMKINRGVGAGRGGQLLLGGGN